MPHEYDYDGPELDAFVLRRYRKAFERFDADHNGTIDRSEFQQLVKILSEHDDHDEAEVAAIFDSADDDKSGAVSFHEFVVLLEKHPHLISENVQVTLDNITFSWMSSRGVQEVAGHVHQSMSDQFFSVGFAAGKKPFTFIFACLVFTAIFAAAGLPDVEPVMDELNTWAPNDAPAKIAEEFVTSNFGGKSSVPLRTTVFASDTPWGSPAAHGTNILTKETLLFLLDVHNGTMALEVLDGIDLFTWTDLCQRRNGLCMDTGILEFFNFDRTAINAATQADIFATVSGNHTSIYGGSSVLEDFAYGVQRDATTNEVTAVDGVFQMLVLPELRLGDDRSREVIADFGDLYVDMVLEKRATLATGTAYPFAGSSLEDEVRKTAAADLPNYIATVAVLVAFTAMGSSRLMGILNGRPEDIHTRIALSFGLIFTVVCGIACAFGLATVMGVEFTTLVATVPFMLVGLAVDDAFVMIGTVDHNQVTRPSGSIAERLGVMLTEVGPSILLTTITDVLALALTTMMNVPAITSFCTFAGLGAAVSFFFIITMFTAFIGLDLRRQEAGRYDVFCCCRRSHARTAEYNKKRRVRHVATLTDGMPTKFFKGCSPLMNTTVIRVLVVVVFLALTVVMAIVAASGTELGLSGKYRMNDDSYMQTHFKAADHFTTEFGTRTMIVSKNIDYSSQDVQTNLLSMTEQIEAGVADGNFVIGGEGRTQSWLQAFLGTYLVAHPDYSDSTRITAVTDAKAGTYAHPVTSALFYSYLSDFLDSSTFSNFQFDIVFKPGTTDTIRASRVWVTIPFQDTPETAVDNYAGLRTFVGQYCTDCLVYNSLAPAQEQALGLVDNFVVVAIVLVCCFFLLTVLFMMHIGTAILTVLTLAMIFVDVLGLLAVFNINLSVFSLLIVLLSIGLNVDYCVHIAHHFMASDHLDGATRLEEALSDRGPSVTKSAVSTIVAVSLLAGADSAMFRQYFGVFAISISMGWLHALLFLPVMLANFNPSRPPTYKGRPLPRLHRVCDDTDDHSATITLVAQRAPVQRDLDTMDCFILDVDDELFVWVGEHSTEQEKAESETYARAFLRDTKRSEWTPVTRVFEGHEGPSFVKWFEDWTSKAPREAVHPRSARTADGEITEETAVPTATEGSAVVPVSSAVEADAKPTPE